MDTKLTDRDTLRKQIITQRKQMDCKELEDLGEKIFEMVTATEWYRKAVCIHCFSGSVDKGEISTTKILDHIVKSDKKLVMPRVEPGSDQLKHIPVKNPDSLITGKWGIKEPENGETVNPGEIDLVLVPGLAADRYGNRIGFGKGFYDRFLAQIPHVNSALLLPSMFILDRIPVKPYDIPMGAIITETEVIYCNRNN